jgi:hypothetical protein
MSIGRLVSGCLGLLAFAFAASPSPADPGAGIVRVLPDNVCGPRDPNAISVCGAKISRTDMRRLHDLATCLVYWERRSTEAAVSAYLRQGDRDRLRTVVVSDHSCAKTPGTRVSGVLLAGALAEAMIANRRFEGDAAPALPSQPTPVDCLYATGRPEAVALVRAKPMTRGEREAAMPLLARLSQCLPDGETMQTSLYVLRAVTALRLYAMTQPAADVVGLQSVALDLGGRDPRPMAVTTLGLTSIPTISMKAAPRSEEDDGLPTRIRRQPPMTGERFDPEELLAIQAEPGIEPDTGEAIVRRPGIEDRRDVSDPY